MTIYTVVSCDDLAREILDRHVRGSYTTRGRAIDECVDYIMERLGVRDDLAWSMANDENHPEAGGFFSRRRKDGVTVVRRGCKGRLKKLLRDELDDRECYYVHDGTNSWYFDVVENGVEGELWHTVTWGDSDCEDPEFTTPWPESFTSSHAAVEAFVNYVKGLYRDNHMELSDELVRETRNSLTENGRAQVDLHDGCSVSCVLYRYDADNIKEWKQ